jgi:hypothetical protein
MVVKSMIADVRGAAIVIGREIEVFYAGNVDDIDTAFASQHARLARGEAGVSAPAIERRGRRAIPCREAVRGLAGQSQQLLFQPADADKHDHAHWAAEGLVLTAASTAKTLSASSSAPQS